MPGINQLPAGAEPAAAISLIWATLSWLCSSVLLWLTWSHHEGFSYLALLSVSSLFSTTFSIVQQSRDITFYQDIVTEQFERKQKLPGDDPELAIAGGSFGSDLVLYYIQYYSYNVQAMLVMFWAAELCQLTYQVGERRKIRRILRKLHVAGKFVSWLLPLITISSLQTPSLRANFVPFILIADLPLMISLAIGSGLMIAVTIRYIQSRQKFTQWSPPNFNSNTSGSEATGTGGSFSGTQSSSRPSNGHKSMGRKGLYDRWLMVRFTIAFVLLAVFEVTNTLFQITALNNNMNDARAQAPDLSAARATQTFFLFMPGTTPGVFIFVVFGTTAASRQKLAAAARQLVPSAWCLPSHRRRGGGGAGHGNNSRRRGSSRAAAIAASPEEGLPVHARAPPPPRAGEITVERSLTIVTTPADHHHHHHHRAAIRSPPPSGKKYGSEEEEEEDYYDYDDPHYPAGDIWMRDLDLKPPGGGGLAPAVSVSAAAASTTPRGRTTMKPLPFVPGGGGGGGGGVPSSRFRTVNATCGGNPDIINNNNTNNNNNGDTVGVSISPVSGRRAATAADERSMTTTTTTTTTSTTLGASFQSRPDTADSLRVPDDYHHGGMDPEHSDDSGPILPIQRHEVRFSVDVPEPGSRGSRQLKNFSRPRK